MMRSGADSTSVEAVFAIGDHPRTQYELSDLGVEIDGEDGVVALYREVQRRGRTTSRLNGRAPYRLACCGVWAEPL